jgi:hypothetical protein
MTQEWGHVNITFTEEAKKKYNSKWKRYGAHSPTYYTAYTYEINGGFITVKDNKGNRTSVPASDVESIQLIPWRQGY